MPPIVWRVCADVTVILHMAYVAFVVLGQLLIVVGGFAKWEWVRSPRFRYPHLAAIVIVVLESWLGITCPLTIYEQEFRRWAGQTAYKGDFIANWVHEALFFNDVNPAVFTAVYSTFGAVVLLSLWLIPPRHRTAQSRQADQEDLASGG
jgi:hypothetical protein